ncbi:MAG: hypothetical protein O3B13_22860 [Planctomycetota bacterium]|nr:hypothetical protein [Planctomycetota bacterium]
MKNLFTTALASLAMASFIVSGCADSTDNSQFSDVSVTESESPDESAHAAHAHPSEGPHGGDLIELGNEEYHAELVHPEGHDDDAHAHEKDGDAGHKEGDHKEGHADDGDHDHAGITIYILDGSARNTVAIDATEITLNLSHDGKPEQFKLAAMPTESDADGKSSRFASADKNLLERFHKEEINGTLVLTINGKSYRGKVTHDHEGHDHGHKH